MALVQVSTKEGKIRRVPRGEMPVIEMDLGDNQRVVQVELHSTEYSYIDRKTVDWRWIATIETRP